MKASDLVIVDLADEVAELRARVSLLEAYRDVARAAVEQLAEQNVELEAARRRIAALVAEIRQLSGAVAA